MGLVFAMGQEFLRKLDFAKNSALNEINNFLCKKDHFSQFGDIFTFPNSCAIQTNLRTKELLQKTLLDNMFYWEHGLELEKKVCDFKVPLGCLGLNK